MNLEQAKQKYKEAQVAYYSGSPIMSDQTFDRLEGWIKSKEPNWEGFRKPGNDRKVEVKLPQFLPSLNKLYPEYIDQWYDKFIRLNWVYMAKLDGNSVYLEYVKGKPRRLITRGDGEYGKDISYFIPYLPIPKKIEYKDRIGFRCEAIIRKSDFESKYNERFDNARNMVAGLLNRKTPDKALADIRLIVLGVFDRPLVDGLKFAFNLGFETVYYRIDKPRKQQVHFEQIKQGKYEADGVVICEPDWIYHYDNAEKPKAHIIAYKENVQYADSIVTDVIYQISSAGRIIPKIKIEPVNLSGASIEYCTSHNAKWMVDHGIGIGAKVRITRSGDVIPKIIDVLEKGEIVYPACEYKMKGVHFIATSRSKEQVVRMLTKFSSTLGIESIKEKTYSTLYDCGVTSLHKLLVFAHVNNGQQRLQNKFGDKKGLMIYEALQTIVNTRWPIAKLMIASCVFNTIGEKRLNAIQQLDFDLLELSSWKLVDIKNSIQSPGIGEATALQIAQGLVDFRKFYLTNKSLLAKPLPYKKPVNKNGKLKGLRIAFTGYRSKEQAEIIEYHGGIVDSFTSKTNILLYSKTGKASSKIAKAGSRAMTWDQFAKKYQL